MNEVNNVTIDCENNYDMLTDFNMHFTKLICVIQLLRKCVFFHMYGAIKITHDYIYSTYFFLL